MSQQALAETLEAFAPLDSERSERSGYSGRRAPQSSLAGAACDWKTTPNGDGATLTLHLYVYIYIYINIILVYTIHLQCYRSLSYRCRHASYFGGINTHYHSFQLPTDTPQQSFHPDVSFSKSSVSFPYCHCPSHLGTNKNIIQH